MGKRKWTDIKALESVISELREAGKTRQEIPEALGLEKVQIKNWINRHNKRQSRIASGLPPKHRGRPRKNEMTKKEEYEYEIQRLKMENKLLRDFLQSTERR